jgi:hypothetical protein
MPYADDLKRLSSRETALADDVKRRDSDPSLGSPSVLARTTTLLAYPTSAQCFYACQPLAVLGTEAEGAPGAVSPESSTFFALNLGGTIPPPGSQVVATFVGNRWVFRYDA